MDIDTKKESNKIQKSNKNENNRKTNKNKKTIEEIKNKQNVYKNKNTKIYSYNSRGFDIIKQKYCMEIINNTETDTVPILCNQENFVLKGNGHIIQKSLEGFHAFIKPATKDRIDGRPINGMFIAIPELLRNKAKDISPKSNRIQAISLETDEDNLMIINVYFPKDPKTKKYHLDSDLEDVLIAIENLIGSHQCDNIVIAGDLNTDYKRENGRVTRLKSFLEHNSFDLAWNTFKVDFTHEFELEGTTFTSTLDHVIWNQSFSTSVLDAGVTHSPSNTSDHSPIHCSIKRRYTIDKNQTRNDEKDGTSTRMLEEDDWERFSYELDHKLQLEKVPDCIGCRNVHCNNDNHKTEIDHYVANVLEAVDSSIKSITKGKRNNIARAKVMPGWTEVVQPFREEAMFWNAVWTSAGKPINTSLHQIMKKTRNQYHYAIRKCKRATENIKKDKLLNACVAGKNNIFDELRKMRSVQKKSPSVIDGNSNPAERFAEVYNKLYNCTQDADDTENILRSVESNINENSLQDVDLVTADVIEEVVKEVRTRKNDPVFKFNSDCIKRAPKSFFQHISNMIKSFLIHGHVSNLLLVATIIPLIKDKLGDMESSDNYRSIALSSVILKVFDWVVITLFGDVLGLDELQFSYQKDCSTTMCTWLVVESISHFSRNNSDIYACFMDMKKAFDMVKHSSLFKKLNERRLSPIFIRLLLVMYKTQTAKVKWEGTESDTFSIMNGVKQGAVLSAILFCIYIDDLLKELRRKGDGCWINGNFVGVIVYADDIVLLSPCIDGLQNMINTCSSYAKSHNLSFSTHENPKRSKTKCVAFQRYKKEVYNLKLNEKDLPWVTSVKHLGSTITDDGRTNQDLTEKRAMYVARNNELVQELYFAHPKTQIWANNVFNTSFYGSPLWEMFSREFEKLEKTWNVSHRIMLSIPRTSHRYFVEPLSDRSHIVKSLKKRFLNFLSKIRESKKSVLRHMLIEIEDDCRSTTGRNLRILRLETGNFSNNKIDISDKPYQEIPNDSEWKIASAKEILKIKSGDLILENLVFKELDAVLEVICCS